MSLFPHLTGLGGSPRLADIGGVPYLIPVAQRSKLYNLAEMATLVDLPGAFVLGAGAGSSRVAGVNCEVCAYDVYVTHTYMLYKHTHANYVVTGTNFNILLTRLLQSPVSKMIKK